MKKTHIIILLIVAVISNTIYAQNSEIENDTDNELLASKICTLGYGSWGNIDPTDEFDTGILREVNTTLEDPDRKKKVSDYLNKYSHILICVNDGYEGIREKEQLLKRSISSGLYGYLQQLAIDEEYSVDFNAYEIIDGKKETILDFIYLIIDNGELGVDYDVIELKALARSISERGGKRGKDLE